MKRQILGVDALVTEQKGDGFAAIKAALLKNPQLAAEVIDQQKLAEQLLDRYAGFRSVWRRGRVLF